MNRDPNRPPFTVPCPTCGVGRGQACRARTTKRITDTHTARFDLAYGGKS